MGNTSSEFDLSTFIKKLDNFYLKYSPMIGNETTNTEEKDKVSYTKEKAQEFYTEYEELVKESKKAKTHVLEKQQNFIPIDLISLTSIPSLEKIKQNMSMVKSLLEIYPKIQKNH